MSGSTTRRSTSGAVMPALVRDFNLPFRIAAEVGDLDMGDAGRIGPVSDMP